MDTMKILFKQKQWLFVQAIFVIVGVITGIVAKAVIIKGPVGGLAVGLQFISNPTEYTIPILFILFSDLAFNVEYIQGTFLTHLICGQSRRVWMLKKSISFYIFLLLQLLIALLSISLGAGVITGHFGLEGIDTRAILQNVKITEVFKEEFVLLSLTILKTVVFVSFGVFVTTLLPGKLVIGSVTSIGAIFIGMKVTALSAHTSLWNSEIMRRIIHIVWMQEPKGAGSWIFGILVLVIFTWFSMERVKRVEIASRGA